MGRKIEGYVNEDKGGGVDGAGEGDAGEEDAGEGVQDLGG